MDRESKERLRLDQRLVRRRGHIAKDELDRALASLPDVSHKAVPLLPEDRGPRGEGGGPEPRG